MGVCFVAYSVSCANLARVQADPPLVWQVLEPEDDSRYLQQLASEGQNPWWQRLLGRKRPEPVPHKLAFATGELRAVDLDKSWDGLRLCIRHCAPAAPDFFEGDGQVGDFEVGCAPAQFVHSATMARFAEALDGIGEDRLLEPLARADFEDVYLAGVWQRRDEEARSYLLENFRELRGFAQHCATHDQAAILQFT